MVIVKRKSSILALLGAVCLTGLLSACGESNQYVAPPPPAVTVAEPLQEPVTNYLEFTGNTAAVEAVEVRARVGGFLESMHFEPGTQVEQGDLLFVIDPRPFQAQLDSAKADLASAKAQLAKAESDAIRLEEAGKKGAVTERDVVAAQADRDAAAAAVAAAEAAVTQAELNLGYTQVTAPITGRVSRNLVDVGNLVGESEPTLLTTVTKYQPIYAYFNLNERDLLRVMDKYREEARKQGIDPEKDPGSSAEIPLQLALANESGFPHEGVLDFAESAVDADTGTLQLRGVFPNTGDLPEILPGLFVRVRMPIETQDNALLVTERALGADQGGTYLLVINSENVVEKRTVRTGQTIDGLVVIEEGLRSDDRVVVNGIQRARAGAEVDPQSTDMATLRTAALLASAETANATSGTEPAAEPDAQPESETAEDVDEAPGAATTAEQDAATETEGDEIADVGEPSPVSQDAEP